MAKAVIVSALLLACLSFSQAQDKIYKKDKSVISCKIIDIGLEEVKYHEIDTYDGPSISIAIEELIKVELSNGRTIEFTDRLNDPSSYVNDRKSALKFHFMSPLFEHFTFSYERNIRPGRSYETSLGIIGLGFNTDEYNKSSGVHLSVGYKFMRTPDFYSRRLKYAHILKGAYVKPQVLLSIYHNEYDDYFFFGGANSFYDKYEQDIVAMAIVVNLGKQIVFDNSFLVDYSIGLGYGFSTQDSIDEDFYYYFRPYHYGFLLGDEVFPIAVTANLKVGFLLK